MGREKRSQIEKRMSPEQIAEAQKLAREWKPKPNKFSDVPIVSSADSLEDGVRAHEAENHQKTKEPNYLFICNNNAEYVDKADNKGPAKVMASASVTISMGQKKAELLLGSKTESLIGARSNSSMDISLEKVDGEIVITGVEDTGNPDTDIFFSYYTDKKELFVSYPDVVIIFKDCVDMG